MDLESIMLSEISQTERDKYVETKKQPPKLIDTVNRLVTARRRGLRVCEIGEGGQNV